MHPEPFVFQHPGTVLRMDRAAAASACPGVPPDDGVLEAVNRFALRPLAPEEVAVFELDLCNNRVDSHFSRFPEEELEKICRLTPGRPLMERHDLRGSLPRGTFFRARLHRDGDTVSVRPEVYLLRTEENRPFILNIEGGVYRETSIGFSFRLPECSVCGKDLRTCDHVPGRAYDGETCHFILRDVVDVIEGSVVPAGSQGTGFVARRGQRAALLPTAVRALEAARAGIRPPRTPFPLLFDFPAAE